MARCHDLLRLCLVALLASAAAVEPAGAQTYTIRRGPRTATPRPQLDENHVETRLEIELLYDGRFGAGLHGQTWAQVFEKLGQSVRITRAVFDQKPEVTEHTLGRLRRVRVVGKLERDGRVVFPVGEYRPDDAAKLKEWLDELSAFGAQGAPAGQPVWGLSRIQFDRLYAELSRKLADDVEGRPLAEALAALKLPEEYAVRLSRDAESYLVDQRLAQLKTSQRLAGFSAGTALAILLNDYGLGYYPQRQPDGSLVLLVEPLSKTKDVWPVGWDLKSSLTETAPRLFELLPIELDDLPLTDVLAAVEARTGIPICIDNYRARAFDIDVNAIRVSYPPRKTSWSLLLRGVTNPHKLGRELKIDERGQPFVWITTVRLGKYAKDVPGEKRDEE